MQVDLTQYKHRLASEVGRTAQVETYGLPFRTNWYKLHLVRMNILALERNNELDVLTDDEVTEMLSFITINTEP